MIELSKENYTLIRPLLEKVGINHLFALAVVNGDADGKVFVDDKDNPQTFYIVHPYTMSLLVGNRSNSSFNNWLLKRALNEDGSRTSNEWLQSWPRDWDPVLDLLFANAKTDYRENAGINTRGQIEFNTRINLVLDPGRFSLESFLPLSPEITIKRTTAEMFVTIKGGVIPTYFYRDAAHFEKEGIAFTVFENGQMASTAFAAFTIGRQLELGIETAEQFRGKGYAGMACAALCNWCIENNYEALWACRLGNASSYKLALRLGFVVTAEIPYYRLSL